MNPIVNQGIDYGVGTAARQLIGSRVPFLPDFYNSRSGDVAGGFRNSQFGGMLRGDGEAWRDYGLKTLGGVGGGMLGGPLGALIGSKFLPWIGDKLFGGPTMPQFSNYGPYSPEAGGYRGLPSVAPQGDFTMPEFTDWEAETRPPAAQAQMMLPRGSVSNFMVGGFPVITGVRPGAGNYSGIGGNYKAVKKKTPNT